MWRGGPSLLLDYGGSTVGVVTALGLESISGLKLSDFDAPVGVGGSALLLGLERF